MNKFLSIFVVLAVAVFIGCSDKKGEVVKSDPELVAMFAGIWVDPDDETVAFKAVGDTLYYPEEGALPVPYRIYGDTLYLDGAAPMKYVIEKFSPHVFQFKNQNGETVKLIKSTDATAAKEFEHSEEPESYDEINQELVKRDTVVMNGEKRYHCYVQVNPTTYKVVKTDYNDEGIGFGKAYHDNIVNLAVFEGAHRLFSSDFRKQDFQKFVPQEVMRQSILSDILYDHSDASGVVFQAVLRIPESASSYLVYITISPEGRKTLSQP